MAFNVDALTDYSWAQIKKACKHAAVSGLVGGIELEMDDGRRIGKYTAEQIKAIYTWATEMETIEDAGTTGGGDVLVNYRERI